MTAKRVLSVGQCSMDHGSISRALHGAFGVEVEPAETQADGMKKLRDGEYALVLVNRIGDADGLNGLDFLRRVKADAALRELPVMLVSNYEDAQAAAVAEGAVPGFGKAALTNPATLDRLRPLLGEGT